MNVPAFDHLNIADSDGTYSDEALHYNDVLNQQLQNNLSDDGYVIPSRTADDISYIVNPANANAKGNGTIWYDTTNHQLVALINGELKTLMVVT